jgi:murein L,D-transpeptidase YcbB/YkuD
MTKFLLSISTSIFSFISCSNDHNSALSNNENLKQESIHPAPELTLDSTSITLFIKTFSVSDSISKEIAQFYKKRNYQLAWFNKNGITYAAPVFYNQLQNYKYNFSDSTLNNRYLDMLMQSVQHDENYFFSHSNNVDQLELALTNTFFQYAKKAYGGTSKNPANLEWFIPRPIKNYQATLDSLVLLSKGKNEQIPLNDYYFRLKKQLMIYRHIEKNGGLPIIKKVQSYFLVGDSSLSLIGLKSYFYLVGDLAIKDSIPIYTDSVSSAIKKFQKRMGLNETGQVDTNTVSEMNKPISYRIKQIMINLERLRWLPADMEKDYVLVNIPEYKLHVFEGGKAVWISNIVVGKSVTQTTIFKGNISEIILNPSWGVPNSIAKNEIVPRIKRDPSYLRKNNMEVLSGNKVINSSGINWSKYKENVPYTFRQKPGKNNALGQIKFLFPNSFDIYLHDTPSKRLFSDSIRAFSHGCIRVADPKTLALYLLKNNKNWNRKRIETVLQTTHETGIRMAPSIPIYITYFTAWVDNKGQLNFRHDVYGLDDKLSKELFNQ